MNEWVCPMCAEDNAPLTMTCSDCASPRSVPEPMIIESGALRVLVQRLRAENAKLRACVAAADVLAAMIEDSDDPPWLPGEVSAQDEYRTARAALDGKDGG